MKVYKRSKLVEDKNALEHLSNVKADLSKRNMSIAELSRLLNLNSSVVYQWINGQCYPIPDNYNKLADFFGWEHFMKGENQ